MMKLGYLSLIIGSVDYLVGVIMLRVVDIELAEILIGLKTIKTTAIGLVGILIGVIVIEGVVMD